MLESLSRRSEHLSATFSGTFARWIEQSSRSRVGEEGSTDNVLGGALPVAKSALQELEAALGDRERIRSSLLELEQIAASL